MENVTRISDLPMDGGVGQRTSSYANTVPPPLQLV